MRPVMLQLKYYGTTIVCNDYVLSYSTFNHLAVYCQESAYSIHVTCTGVTTQYVAIC